MERKTPLINLDEPWIEQKAFSDFLNTLNEQPKTEIYLHEILKAAKVVIKNELSASGYSEEELVGIKLECEAVQQENIEEIKNTYSAEWGIVKSQIEKINTTSLSQERNTIERNKKTVITSEFSAKLIERLDEVIMKASLLSKLETFINKTYLIINFSSQTIIEFLECSNDCIVDGTRYKKNSKGKCTKVRCRII